MTYFTLQSDNLIEGVNNRALSKAIGERLQDSLDKNMAMPPHLVSLLKQMRLSDVSDATR